MFISPQNESSTDYGINTIKNLSKTRSNPQASVPPLKRIYAELQSKFATQLGDLHIGTMTIHMHRPNDSVNANYSALIFIDNSKVLHNMRKMIAVI